MRDNILEICNERSDEWSDEVKTHILSCIDLVAAEAIYHTECVAKYRFEKPKKTSFTISKKNRS